MRNKKKLIPKAQLGQMITDPSAILKALGGANGQGAAGFGNLKGMLGGLKSGGIGMIGDLGGAALAKGNFEQTGGEQAVHGITDSVLKTLGPKGQLAAAALNLYTKGVSDKTKKGVGKDRFGNQLVDSSMAATINPLTRAGLSINEVGQLLKGQQNLGTTLENLAANSLYGKVFGIKSSELQQQAREGEDYRNALQTAQDEDRLRRAQAQQLSQERFRDRQTAGFGTLYAKRGGKIGEPCGCSKDKDGLDTDVFYAMPRKLLGKVMERVNLKPTSQYNDKIKVLIKNSVPKGQTLRQFVDSISPEVASFINEWENGRSKV